MVYRGQRGRKRKTVKKGRPWLAVCFWTLVLAVGLSLAFPKAAKSVRNSVTNALGIDLDGAVTVFGDDLRAGKNIFSAAKGAFVRAFSADNGKEIPAEKQEGSEAPAMKNESEEPSNSPEPVSSGEEQDPVETFKSSQSVFMELGLPGNVTYEMPEIKIPLTTPVSGTVTSGFGYREHPSDGEVRFHYGLDIAAGSGTDAVSIADGTVAAVGDSTSYGLYVIIRHADGVESLYAHLSEVCVNNGDEVKAGEKLGTVGQTGNATAPCLHLELLVDGDYVNPGYYLYI